MLAAFAVGILTAPAAEARYASIIVDYETGEVLHAVNADTRNYPASLAKMMTLYLTFEALEDGNLTLDMDLPVSRRAAGMAPSKLGLKAGSTIKVQDAILALVTKSANDAAVVIAEALGTTEGRFARLMTKKARKLGMKRTTFRNASGLPNRAQLSTARDLATLARALIRDFPQYYDVFSTTKFKYAKRTYRNHNSLLRRYEGADGLKTGYIRASGFNLAASAVRDGRRLVGVVLGGKSPRSRDRHLARLLDRGFAQLAVAAVERAPALPPRKPEPALAVVSAEVAAEVTGEAADATVPGPGAAEAPAGAGDAVDMGSAEEAPPDRTWGVQVGAYYRRQLAEAAANGAMDRLPDLLGGSQVVLPYIRGQRGRIHRARLVGLTEADARAACGRLEALKADCLVVRAEAPQGAAPESAATN